jgi:hypothetical protein
MVAPPTLPLRTETVAATNMQADSQDRSEKSRTKAVVAFLIHQSIAMLFVAFASGLVISIFAIWTRLFGWTITSRQSSWILTETPYFPVQICLGLFLGWSLSGWLRHRVMLWVWVIPTVILCSAVAAFPWVGQICLKQYAYLSSSDRLSHFFGWGCRPENRCLDQILTTLPFYSAVAYSVGAHVARRKASSLTKYRECMNGIRVPRVLIPGVGYACYELFIGWRTIGSVALYMGWRAITLALAMYVAEIAFVTYVFAVAISLI